MGEGVRHAGLMVAAGVGIPVLAALNANLGARIGSPVAAAVVLFAVGFATGLVVLLATGAQGPWPGRRDSHRFCSFRAV